MMADVAKAKPAARARTRKSPLKGKPAAESVDAGDLDSLKARNMALRNEELRIKNESRTSGLVPIDDFRRVVYRISTEAKSQFDSLPASFAQQFGDGATEDMIDYLHELCGNAAAAIIKAADG